MNHSGDTNKMVDTPRTDAHIDGLRRDPEVSGCDRTLDFARQLERELNAANAKIKRLVEAGDAVFETRSCECQYEESAFYCRSCTSAWAEWEKAKEAKP